jgi:hypothetical protein
MMGAIEEYIHGLSQIEFVHGTNKDLPSWSSAKTNDREHVAILDGLALLLVFAAKGDSQAMSLDCCGVKIMLEDRNELRYVEDLFAKARSGVPTEELHIKGGDCYVQREDLLSDQKVGQSSRGKHARQGGMGFRPQQKLSSNALDSLTEGRLAARKSDNYRSAGRQLCPRGENHYQVFF